MKPVVLGPPKYIGNFHIELHPLAYAMRPVRIIGNTLRYYEAVTFPGSPRTGISMYLRRCLGQLRDDGSDCLLDILDEHGDVIQDFPVTKDGFEYLRRSLKFRLVTDGI